MMPCNDPIPSGARPARRSISRLRGTAAAGAPQTVDVKQDATLQTDGALLLDVRETDECAAGHVPASTVIPFGQLQQRLQEIGGYKNQPVVVICRSDNRSAKAVKLLEQAEVSAASNVGDGMIAWQKAGLPVIGAATAR